MNDEYDDRDSNDYDAPRPMRRADRVRMQHHALGESAVDRPKEERTPVLEQTMRDLIRAVNRLGMAIGQTNDRISPILSPTISAPAEEAEKDVPEEFSPFASELCHIIERLNNLVEIQYDILERIEL